MSENAILRGSFTSTGAAQIVPIPSGFNYLRVINQTVAQTDDPAGPLFVSAEWDSAMAPGSAILYRKLTGDNTLENPACTANGFTLIDNANPGTNAAVALGNPSFTQADPSRWLTGTVHGFAVGDIVRVTSTTGARQYSSLDLSVITVSDTTHFDSLLDTTGITQATAGFARKLNFDTSLFYPRKRYVAKVTTGVTTTVRLTVAHDFSVGEYVRFIIPAVFGMTQLDGLRGRVTAVNTTLTTNTITVDIDSTAFTAFAFPATGAVPFTFAQVVPDGEFPQYLAAATENVGIIGVKFGTSVVGTANDVIRWYAYRADQSLVQ